MSEESELEILGNEISTKTSIAVKYIKKKTQD